MYGRVISKVAFLNSKEAAKEVLFMQVAWHMHHSQPSKYRLDSIERVKLLDLCKQFIREFSN